MNLPTSIRFTLVLSLAVGLAGCANNNRPNVTVNAGCVACNVVSANGQAKATTPGQIAYLNINVPADPSSPVIYTWHNRAYQGAEAFLGVVRADIAAQLETIKPSPTPPYGSLQLAFPTRPAPTVANQQNTVGTEEARNAFATFWQLIDDGRLKALEKSKMFASVSSQTANISIMDLKGADYGLWFDRGLWQIRYHEGNPVDFADLPEISVWLKSLDNLAKFAKTTPSNPLLIHNPPASGGKVWFTLLNKEYFAVEPMMPVLDAEYLRQSAETLALTNRIGGKAKIVLATFDQAQQQVPKYTDPENNKLAAAAMRAQNLAYARARVEALRRSKIFDSITVETADISDMAVAGYDYVLWQPALTPWSWRYRVAGRTDAYTITVPPNDPLSNFAESVRDHILKVR